MSGGYTPLACGIIHDKIWQILENHPSGHTVVGYTHAANPLSTATSLAVLRYIQEQQLVARSRAMGEKMFHLVGERLARCGLGGWFVL